MESLTRGKMTSSSPFPITETGSIFQRFRWPISWITLPDVGESPYVLGFKLEVEQPEDATVRFYVTADERYELLLDGKLVARGPERGSPDAWFYTTLDLPIAAGRHVLFARVWAIGEFAPCAQMTVRPGFLLGVGQASDGGADARWSTGLAPWEVKRLDGYQWIKHDLDFFAGRKVQIDGNRYPWGIELGQGQGWTKAVKSSDAFTAHPTDLTPIRLLVPGTFPQALRPPRLAGNVRFVEDVLSGTNPPTIRVDPQSHLPEIATQVQALLDGRSSLRIPAGKKYRAIIDLQNYFCAYPHVQASGGKNARLTLGWAEALYQEPGPEIFTAQKANRNITEGRFFIGLADTFIFDGGANRDFSTLWWQAGRYLELQIETKDEALVLNRLALEETRYPLEMESTLDASDKRLEDLVPILLRTLQVNAHETFMDCPYYEQLNYVGDTLIDCLVVYTITQDVRLPRKSLQLFHDSRIPYGLTQSRFPSRIRQLISTFSLLWVSMVRNHAWWRGEPEFIRSLLPAVRGVIDLHLLHINSDGLLSGLPGWNFLDWIATWSAGVPPDGDVGGVSGPLNWLFVYVLQAATELERYAGDPELAARYARFAQSQAKATEAVFWNEQRGLFADDAQHRFYSEHAQCLAILSGKASESLAARAAHGLLNDGDLSRCTIYFTHYLFETLRLLDQAGPLFQRLEYWHSLKGQGFVTTPEMPEPSRSDCHAWGSHPLYHFYATILGVRPASFGFDQVEIRPRLGPLQHAKGRMVHPKGWIEVDVQAVNGRLEGAISLPEGITGTFHGSTGSIPLVAGVQKVRA